MTREIRLSPICPICCGLNKVNQTRRKKRKDEHIRKVEITLDACKPPQPIENRVRYTGHMQDFASGWISGDSGGRSRCSAPWHGIIVYQSGVGRYLRRRLNEHAHMVLSDQCVGPGGDHQTVLVVVQWSDRLVGSHDVEQIWAHALDRGHHGIDHHAGQHDSKEGETITIMMK